MTYPVRIDRRVWVPMEDGTRVALTLYLPDAAGDGPFPAVIESLPYRKDDDCFARDYRTYTYLAERGIAGVRVDIRGTGASTGTITDEYTEQEQRDNLAVMDWLVAQDWCNGNLGMWGISWGGFSALQTAMLRPTQLKAIAAMHATNDRFACDVHYTGGSAHAAEQLDWPGSMVTTNALPPDPEIFGDGWFEEWMQRLENTPQWPLEWLRHQHRDKYWLHGSPCADYEAIQCPTLLVGGWLDGYVDGMVALAENLTCPTRTIIGPWGHYRPATGVPAPTLDHFDLLARWFGHHLRGDENGVMDMPPVTVFTRNRPPYDRDAVEGAWRAESSWPPDGLQSMNLRLSDLAHGSTTWSGPQWIGSHAPFWDRAGFPSQPSNKDDKLSMTFESEVFDEPAEILGTPIVKARVSIDKEVGLLAARLVAVDPDGTGHLICRGSRNLAFANDLSEPTAPRAGEPFEATVPLMATSAVIPAGWRLRLSLSGADFPVVWPPSEKFTISIDPARSRLILPIVDSTSADDRLLQVPPAPETPPAPVEEARSVSEWTVETDGDVNLYRMVRGGTEHQPDLVYSTDQWWTVTVSDNDPSTTEAKTVSVVSLERPGWSVAAEGTLRIEACDAFEVTIELAARHNGKEVFRRLWAESIPRHWA